MGQQRAVSGRRAWIVGLGTALLIPALAAAAGDELPERFRQWLAEVELLISDEERQAFLGLEEAHRRDAFVERFWLSRDPFPETRRNEFREAWEERLTAARERFATPDDARAQALLLAGEPRSVEHQPCPEHLRAIEVWSYAPERGRGGGFSLVFLAGPGESRLWSPREGLPSLLHWRERGARSEFGLERSLAAGCPRGEELVAALTFALDLERLRDRATWIPRPSGEWVGTFLARSTRLPSEARTFSASLSLAFPGRRQSRIVVQGLITVPVEECHPEGAGEPPAAFQFVVDGEILRGDSLFDTFRYRFDLPAGEVQDRRIPLVVQRYLRSGRYTMKLRVHDRVNDRYHRVEREIIVPRAAEIARQRTAATAAPVPVAPAPQPTTVAQPEVVETIGPRLAEANRNLDRDEHRLLLRVPEKGLLTGTVRVEATSSSQAIAKVAFLLNGRPVMTKSRPPFSVELNLGHAPRLHRLVAVAYDAQGRELTRDRVPLNVGPHRFAVRLLEPRPGRYESSLRARAEVDLPRGAKLDRVELFLNETRLATLFQPPFIQPLLLPRGGEISYVRAVAYLEDGNSAEDLVFVNAPQNLDSLEVDFVELYTSVVDRAGRPVEGLRLEQFEVLEDGLPQRIVRFERVRDLPIHAGVLIDTSTSMAEELRQAERAALKFFQRVIQPKDRAAVFLFSDEPELRVPLTNSHEVLAGGLAGLTAEGETTLYDAIVYGVYYFAGIRGKRALILLTDGQDSNSRHTFDETLDFARRAGVAIYAIGLNLSSRDFEVRNLLRRLARETGGESFMIERAARLDTLYERIEEELRTQYLLGYQSSQQASEAFREVEVRLDDPGMVAKTIPGYYP